MRVKRVDEGWQSQIYAAGNLTFTFTKYNVDECFNYVFTSVSYIILLEEHSSTAKQDPLTAINPAFIFVRKLLNMVINLIAFDYTYYFNMGSLFTV